MRFLWKTIDRSVSGWAVAWALQLGPISAAEPAAFRELYDLVRSNVVGVSEAELDRAAVRGLLDQLKPYVMATTNELAALPTDTPVLSRATVYDDAYAYLRVGRVEKGLAEQIAGSVAEMTVSNTLKGVVVDLRYAGGLDFAEAAAVADRFLAKEQTLLSWGDNVARSTAKTNAIGLPVAVLINHATAGAAEALAGVLRHSEVGLVIGAPTAGRASLFKDFTLSDGQPLRLATAPVKLADGQAMAGKGLSPDIHVVVGSDDEKAYYADAYRVVLKASVTALAGTNTLASSTNRPARRRINEAELVRMQREGGDADVDAPGAKATEPDKPLITDPALVRALDLLKGLAVVQKLRPL